MNMKIPQKYLQNRISNIRQDYATINKSIVDKLNPPNLYRFFCLSLYRNDYYKVRWRIKDLAKRTGEEETALKKILESLFPKDQSFWSSERYLQNTPWYKKHWLLSH